MEVSWGKRNMSMAVNQYYWNWPHNQHYSRSHWQPNRFWKAGGWNAWNVNKAKKKVALSLLATTAICLVLQHQARCPHLLDEKLVTVQSEAGFLDFVKMHILLYEVHKHGRWPTSIRAKWHTNCNRIFLSTISANCPENLAELQYLPWIQHSHQ